jgi:putative redox protein
MAAEPVEGRVTVRGAGNSFVQDIMAGSATPAKRRTGASDCAVGDTETAMLSVIDRDIEFEGPLSGAQRDRLLAIANRCQVHLTLTSRIDIRTTLRTATPEQMPLRDPPTS